MNTEEKTKIFLERWELLLQRIATSKTKHKDKNSIKVADFYMTRAEFVHKDDKYCLVCYKDYSREVDVPNNNSKGNKIVLTKDELLDYYLNGWNKSEEIDDLKKLLKENMEIKEYIKKTNDFSRDAEFREACQGIWSCMRGLDRLRNEKKCVAILIKYLGLPIEKGN